MTMISDLNAVAETGMGRAKCLVQTVKASLLESLSLWQEFSAGRGTMIARKALPCLKNERRTETHEAIRSATATLALCVQRVVTDLADLIMSHSMQMASSR